MTTLPPSPPPPPPGRPWLAPAIASAIAAVGLLALLIPGVLRFPMAAVPEEPVALAALEEGNRTLESEIARLRGATDGGVCVYDGGFYPSSVQEAVGPPAADSRLDLLPPPPATLRPTPDALPPADAKGSDQQGDSLGFDGTIDELLKRSSVLILRPEGDSLGSGTGLFVTNDTILTNSHVVGEADEVLVTNELIGEALPGKVLVRTGFGNAAGSGADFALVRIPAAVETALPLSFAPAQRTQQVYASGYPSFFVEAEVAAYAQAIAGGTPAPPPAGVVTNGIVTTVQDASDVTHVLHTAGLSPGNSGGPLVDLCGRVVGINTFITQSNDEQFVHGDYALSSEDIVAFLQANGLAPQMSADACAPERVAASAGK